MSRKLFFRRTQDLRVAPALFQMLQRDVLWVARVELGLFKPSLATTPTKTVRFFAKLPKIVSFFANMHVGER